MNIKKTLLIILLLAIIAVVAATILIGSNKIEKNTDKLKVVVTNFAAYDFVRQIAGDNVELNFLLEPGVEAHSYDPTAKDLVKIQEADIFIYIGGNVEQWADKILETINKNKTKTICLLDTVTLIPHEHVESSEEHNHEHTENNAFEEHIWTSPKNAIQIVGALANILSENDSKNSSIYKSNASKYIAQIKNVQAEIQKIVDNKKRNKLIFGDKMPMQYFLNEFGLTASAAFNGCSTDAEPSSSTIANLVEEIKEENIPVILYIELSNGKVANTIAENVKSKYNRDTEIMQIQSLHNVSKTDFENGETYVTLMTRNLAVLKAALQ